MQTPWNRCAVPRGAALAPVLMMAMLTLLAGVGCQGSHKLADPVLARDLSPLVYPKDAPLGEDLDIVVIRSNRQMELVNRMPRSYSDVTLWVNQQYVGRPVTIDVGSSLEVDLTQYVNKHGEEYPVGWLLGPDLRFPVHLVELFDPSTGKRHRLTVDIPR